jgi:two-component system alkaline phosphatase synthesis response regulator PhoP
MRNNILLVEDDPGLAYTLKDRLEAEGYDVTNIDDGNLVQKELNNSVYNLMILDLMLKGKNGLDVCYELRSRGNKIPVLMLTAKGQTSDKVTGFKIGADDYVTKPFEVAELLARIEALLRRSNTHDVLNNKFKFAGIEIDLHNIEVKKKDIKLDLSVKEFQLLKYLIINRGRIISRDELLNEVWGYDDNPSTRTVDTHIGWLRQKLENNPKEPIHILTIHGFGYKFADE